MKKRLALLCVPAVFAMPSVGTARVVVNETNSVDFEVFVPCANDGAGELVLATLRLHTVVVETVDANGVQHLKFLDHPQGGMGVGQTTGDVYQATGMTGEQINVAGGGLPLTATLVNNFRWIGPGPSNNLLVHETLHVTIDENGEVKADVDNSSVECR